MAKIVPKVICTVPFTILYATHPESVAHRTKADKSTVKVRLIFMIINGVSGL